MPVTATMKSFSKHQHPALPGRGRARRLHAAGDATGVSLIGKRPMQSNLRPLAVS
jgi:hypothetical protein